MHQLSKQSRVYLQNINQNSQEKVEIIKNAIEKRSLPKCEDSFFRIVEMGVGGGGPLKELKLGLETREDIKIIGVDIIPTIVDSLKDIPNIKGVVASVDKLPLENNSVSAINASAILHEVSSYGTDSENNQEYGLEAVEKTLKEFKRILLPSGLVACRDILAPSVNLHTPKTVRYYPPSWRMFAEFFLTDFVTSPPAFYQSDKIDGKVFDNTYVLDAPIGLHRELQRHYLMFRDYIRNVEADEFGIKIKRAYWLDQSKGLKFITFTIKRKYSHELNLEHFDKKLSIYGKLYKGTSDLVDQLYDELIQFKFEQMAKGTEDGAKFAGLIGMWKQREGHEHYIYGNFGDILLMLTEPDKDGYVLFPEQLEDLDISPRDYYNAYLRRIIDLPEFDGKQIITLKKMTRLEAYNSIHKFKVSPLITPETLEKIQQKLA